MTTVSKTPQIVATGATFRTSGQELAPDRLPESANGPYCLYPSFPISPETVGASIDALAFELVKFKQVRIDGYLGIFWSDFRHLLQEALTRLGVEATWLDVTRAQKSVSDIESMLEPFLGGSDPLFGTRFTGSLIDFFDAKQLSALQSDAYEGMTVLYGCGAALVDWDGPLVYVDLPKNELQFRSRAGKVLNLGCDRVADPKNQYKRFYFIDWPVLNAHKASVIDRVDWFVDGQRPGELTFVAGSVLREALDRMSRNVFRARPWFEPGPWGGQWLKSRIAQLPQGEKNYAWSFELISPENGIAFADGHHLCEVSFDWLMYRAHHEVLGESADRFGYEFPMRFDFLDTMDGGNLSLQCHPRTEYIRKHFGESFTQDESYYIVDCKPEAKVYLGFRQGIDANKFRAMLEHSHQTSTAVEVEQFVETVPARRHDLFLIPSGTVHCSGVDNMVLEISATPYIFTFKMYDWLRLGLDGVSRPLNIDRAFENLRFDRQGDEVERQLISKPATIAEGSDWRLVHLPTHEEHFYDVHRYEFDSAVSIETDGSPHVLMLVDGTSILVETEGGMREQFNYIETFIVPAAARSYELINQGESRAIVVKAFIKRQSRRGL